MRFLIFGFVALCYLASSYAGLLPHPFGHAIQIQNYDRSGTNVNYAVDTNALNEFLAHPEIQNRKIVAFSIIGAYRRGKSFFLDYCLRYLYANYKSINTQNSFTGPQPDWIGSPDEPLKGFSWKPGMTADTQGILFWSDIFLYDAPNGDKIAIIIMDTQGLFEPGVSADFNSRIFGLSTLISSMQVINLNGVIQEDQLQYLEMSVEFTKLANKNQNSQWKPFQDLTFLIRDWADEETGLGYEGGNVVFDQIFVKNVAHNQAAENVRRNIKNAFDKISTFLLPHPGLEVTKKNFNGGYQKLDSDFVANLKTFIESNFKPEKLVFKKVFGKVVNGAEFKDLIVSYFNAFNSNDLPKIESIFETTANREMDKILTPLHQEYSNAIRVTISGLNIDDANIFNHLQNTHNTLKSQSVEKFRAAPKMGGGALEQAKINQLSNMIENSYQEMVRDVRARFDENQIRKAEIIRLENERIAREQEVERLRILHEAQLAEQARIAAEQERLRQEEYERQIQAAQQPPPKKKWYKRWRG